MSAQPTPSTKKRRVPWSVRILVVLLVAYISWCAVLFFKQDALIFPTHLAGRGTPQLPHRRDFEQVWVNAPDGVKVEGWFFHARESSSKSPKPCLVLFHGNGELIDDLQDYADYFLSLGLPVLVVEYRGYGRSGGMSTPPGSPRAEPSERGIVDNSMLFIDWLGARPEVASDKLAYYGRSLGTGVAAQVAARRRPAAIILESPFSSIASFASGFGVPAFLLKHPFRTDRELPPLAAAGLPVLLVHSRTDEIVPFSHGERLKALMPSATLVEISGAHSASPLAQDVYERAVSDLLVRAGLRARP